MDKQGVGDSEGNCAENDFESRNRCGYRTAFRALKNYDFIDTNQVYILGIRNGGGFAPLVPETDAKEVRGARLHCRRRFGGAWFEHMSNRAAPLCLNGQVTRQHKQADKRAATLYYDWLIKERVLRLSFS